MKTLEVAMAGIGAALYAGVGWVAFSVFPVFAPAVGIVRFWPVVFIPAVVAALFGPRAGGISAAIGIFISDVLIHGDPLLSLTAGVTSNFLGFYLVGLISRKNLDWKKVAAGLGVGLSILVVAAFLVANANVVVDYYARLGAEISASDVVQGITLLAAAFIFSYALVIAIWFVKPSWRNFGIASVVGLMVGSAIIGVGVWGYSQLFVLPKLFNSQFQLPYYAGLILYVWTFATEIPFFLILGPPIIEASYRAFPFLKPQSPTREKS